MSGATIASGYGGNGPRDTVTHASMALGVGLVLASQLLQAVQLVSDPGAHQRVLLSPLKVVGVEGLLGAALTVSGGLGRREGEVGGRRLRRKASVLSAELANIGYTRSWSPLPQQRMGLACAIRTGRPLVPLT